MPIYKKRRTTKRPTKGKKRSYAMVPRPRLNGELAHRHIVTCSTSTGTSRERLFIQYVSASNSTEFVSGPDPVTGGYVTSPNLSMSWSLANMVIGLGGTPAISIPMPNVAELIQLYDTYQIEKVECTVFFGNTESLVSGDSTSGYQWVMPLIGYAPDTDDASNTSITQLQQYSTYKCHQTTMPLRMNLVPCPAGAVFDPSQGSGAFNAGFTRLQRQDINVGYSATPHYGLKMAVDGMLAQPPGSGGAVIVLCSIQTRVHLLMKNTR